MDPARSQKKSGRAARTGPLSGLRDPWSLAAVLLIMAAAAVGARAALSLAGKYHLLEFKGVYGDILVLGAALLAAASGYLICGRLRWEAGEARDLVSEALARCGDRMPVEGTGIREVARAAAARLDGLREERAAARDGISRVRERRLEFLTVAYADLIAHHRITKKMLRCSRVADVYQNLLQGIREGLGFRGALIGFKEPDGCLVFRDLAERGDRSEARVPVWDERSVLARTLWHADPAYFSAPVAEGGIDEDRRVLGDGGAFLVPLMVQGGPSRPQIGLCWSGQGHPAPGPAETDRCWIARAGGPEGGGVPGRMECAQCDCFPGTALLVVRASGGGRPLRPDRTAVIVAIANEAGLALEFVALHEGVRKMSVTDGLTGLVNHREFFNAVRRELERARRYGRTVSLLMIDLDDFKRVNDRFGHLAGDAVLRKVADLLRACARASDVVARYGGEEFGIIMPESTPSGALMLAERIKTEIANHDFLPHVPGGVRLTASVGIFSTEDGAVSEDELVGFADEAAYQAKSSGKNRVVVKTNA